MLFLRNFRNLSLQFAQISNSQRFNHKLAFLPGGIELWKECLEHESSQERKTTDFLKRDPKATPILVPEELKLHRKNAMKNISLEFLSRKSSIPQNDNHILIVTGADSIKNRPFKQISEFLYLCDCLDPGCILLAIKSRYNCGVLTMLLKPLKDLDSDYLQQLSQFYNVTYVGPTEILRRTLIKLVKNFKAELWHKPALESHVTGVVYEVASAMGKSVRCPTGALDLTRSLKTPREQEGLRRANEIAAQTLKAIISISTSRDAPTMVGSIFGDLCNYQYAQYMDDLSMTGPLLQNGMNSNFWMMRGSCHYGGYIGTISRTWGIEGNFTKPQQFIYNALKKIRNDLLSYLYSNYKAYTPNKLHEIYLNMLGKYLKRMLIMDNVPYCPDEFQVAINDFSYYKSVVTHLGLDMPYLSPFLDEKPFQKDQVFTIRPTIFIPSNCAMAKPEFRGLFCSISDSFIVKDKGLELLTRSCPVTTNLIERSHSNIFSC